MGDRAGYTVVTHRELTREDEDGNKLKARKILTAPYLRKQWCVEPRSNNMKKMLKNIARGLVSGRIGEDEEIGSGSVALRNDLTVSPGRLFHALVDVLGQLPFDGLSTNVPHDISDNGLFEIEALEWNYWKLNNYEVSLENKVDWDSKVTIAEVKFEEGESIDEGTEFEWLWSDDVFGRW